MQQDSALRSNGGSYCVDCENEPDGSLPHSQEPAIWPYPEPDQSSPLPEEPYE